MDKKKVKELIENAIYQLDPFTMDGDNYRDFCKNTTKILEEALKELSKSDWVSVEDGLPDCYEKVLVCNEKEPKRIYLTNRTDQGEIYEGVDKNGFYYGYNLRPITHWKPIEKLEE